MSRVEVAPGSTEHTLTYCVMLEQLPEGFKEFVIRAAGPAQRRVLFQELKGSVFTWMPSCLWRKSTSIRCLENCFPKLTSGRSDSSWLAVTHTHTHPKFTHTTFAHAYRNAQLPLMCLFSFVFSFIHISD